MDDPIQYAADQQDLKNISEKYSLASKQNQELNDLHKKHLEKYYDNIALYSAGAITFSTTILGFVLPNNAAALGMTVFLIPTLYYLYFSWVGFLIGFLGAVISRKLDAYYLSAFGFTNYTKRYYEFLETQLTFMTKYPGQVIVTGGNKDESMDTDKINIQKLKEAHKKNDQSTKNYFFFMQLANNASQMGAILGIIFLLLFAFFLTKTMVFSIPSPTKKILKSQEIKHSFQYPSPTKR